MAVARKTAEADKRQEAELKEKIGELILGLNEAKEGLAFARMGFEMVSEPDLVDFYVYQMTAFQKKYSFYLTRLREEEARMAGIYAARNLG